MLVGGVIEKWNILVDFEGKKCTPNIEMLIKCIGRVLNAYPYRLKRLLMVNCHNANEAFVSQIASLLRGYDPEIIIESIKNFEILTKYISTEERERKYGGTHNNACEFWPIHTTNKNEETESNISKTEY